LIHFSLSSSIDLFMFPLFCHGFTFLFASTRSLRTIYLGLRIIENKSKTNQGNVVFYSRKALDWITVEYTKGITLLSMAEKSNEFALER